MGNELSPKTFHSEPGIKCEMSGEQFELTVVAFFVGLGLLAAGLANLLLRRRSTSLRIAASLLVIGIVLGGVWAITETSSSVERTGLILAGILATCQIAGSTCLTSSLASASAMIRPAAIRWGLVTGAGLATAVGSALFSEYQIDRDIDFQMTELELLTSAPPATVPPDTHASTDQGSFIEIKEALALRNGADLERIESAFLQNAGIRDSIIRCESATDQANCHGWTFTGGRYWISGVEVDRILTENRYQAINDPQPGDLVVYRSETNVLHTGIVRYVSDGQPVLVEGKWGCTGVFLHAVDKSIYGSSFTYYRSSRRGHILAGLDPSGPRHSQFDPVIPDPDHPDEFTE